MSVIETQMKIQRCIDMIDIERPKLSDMAHTKAVKIAEYEKAIAVTIMKLNAGKPAELDGETIKDPAKSIMEKLAKGLCWQEKLASEVADSAYKSQVLKLDCVKAQLSGYQSVNRFLDNT